MPIPAIAFTLLKSPLFWKIAAIVAAIAAAFAFVAYRDHTIRVEEAAKWKPKIAACDEARNVAVEANKTLQASADKLAATIAQQNAAINDLKSRSDAAQRRKDAELAAALAKEANLRAEVARLTAIANRPPVVVTDANCMEVVNETDRTLRLLLAR